MIPTALTIAGSDSSGGAGIQADLKTFAALNVYGMSAIAALTAQNTIGVAEILEVPPSFLASQIDTVVSDIRPGALKTGMLYTKGNIEVVAEKVREYRLSNLVIDPVMASTSGSRLFAAEALDSLQRFLLPLALIVTPNLDEAGALTGRSVKTMDDVEEAALQIQSFGPKYVYIKGGHLEGAAADLLFDGEAITWLTKDRVISKDTHGTGCILSAAIAAYLARGETLHEAVRLAKDFVTVSIQNALRLGKGSGPCDPMGSHRKG